MSCEFVDVRVLDIEFLVYRMVTKFGIPEIERLRMMCVMVVGTILKLIQII